MKTQQVNLRLEIDLISAIEHAAEEESLDRGTMFRKLLLRALAQWRIDRALERYQRREISLGRAAEDSGLSHWELIDEARRRGIAYPLELADVEEQLAMLERGPRVAEGAAPPYGATPRSGETRVLRATHDRNVIPDSLPDRPPRPGGILLVGINPAPVSAAAGHYYQGRLGKRLWKRLSRLGLLLKPTPGEEDDAFVAAGHGLTDIVKRVTGSAADLDREELRRGVEDLRQRVRSWRPGLIVFAFKEAARAAMGSGLAVGKGPSFEGVPTFLLSGPYAAAGIARRVDDELLGVLSSTSAAAPAALTQRVTPRDLAVGIIRLPTDGKRFFPERKGSISFALRGIRVTASYDPRNGPDRQRSGVLRIEHRTLSRLVRPDERLRISRAEDGTTHLD